MEAFFGSFLLCIGLTLLIGSLLSFIGWVFTCLEEVDFRPEMFIKGSFLVAFVLSLGVIATVRGCILLGGIAPMVEQSVEARCVLVQFQLLLPLKMFMRSSPKGKVLGFHPNIESSNLSDRSKNKVRCHLCG